MQDQCKPRSVRCFLTFQDFPRTELRAPVKAAPEATGYTTTFPVHLTSLNPSTPAHSRPPTRQWREAVRVSYAHQRPDLVDTVVGPAAAEAGRTVAGEAAEAAGRIRKYGARLAEVRARRLALAEAVAAAGEDGGSGVCRVC